METNMLASINNMKTVAQLCRTSEPLPAPLATWLAASLQAYLDQRSDSLNDAFGLRNARGGVPWRMEASIRVRDAALRRLASDHLGDLSVTAQAERIRQLSLRYAASSWRFDREQETMPVAYQAQSHEWLWRAFKSGASMPLGIRQLRTILGS
jgi:hypothetical protein